MNGGLSTSSMSPAERTYTNAVINACLVGVFIQSLVSPCESAVLTRHTRPYTAQLTHGKLSLTHTMIVRSLCVSLSRSRKLRFGLPLCVQAPEYSAEYITDLCHGISSPVINFHRSLDSYQFFFVTEYMSCLACVCHF